ncbi:MAG: 1-deoxy-D-xylulose-5-phosphate synthase [Rikenellaceae bacterium]
MDKSYQILDRINSPAELKKLSEEQLILYCQELREYIIEECAVNPGHLSSSLGAIELSVAIHYVYDTPTDKLIWDVGHQTYPHKIITGRFEAFAQKRKRGGISGFPKMSESEYDAFGGGHASVSISAAFGMAKAAELKGEEHKVVAVIGDGSMTGGLAFEGLNNAGASPDSDLLVILNDNHMAIDSSVGALSDYLLKISTSRRYNKFKQWLWRGLTHVPKVLKMCQLVGNAIKQGLLRNSNLFESLNFRYFGIADGHDIYKLVKVLRAMRKVRGPKILHVATTKGKGYTPAENNMAWHAPGKFDPKSGERVKSGAERDRYQDVFGHTLIELAKADDRVVGITPAMLSGCSMNKFMECMPERCYDVGIAEGHAVTFAAGMAASGMVPFCNVYSTFMQRAYDNIIHDVAIQSLPVVLCLDRGGLVGEDGATHHGAYDLAYLSVIPSLIVAAPRNELELKQLMYTALQCGSPFALRYPRGEAVGAEWRDVAFEALPIGRGEKLLDGQDVAILTIGHVSKFAYEAIERLSAEGIKPALYDLRYAKPLDEELLLEVARNFKYVVTVEDGALRGGVGEAVAALFSRVGQHNVKVRSLGIPDRFIHHGTPQELWAECGFDASGVERAVREMLDNRSV